MTTTGSRNFHHKNQIMEFVMKNEMLKLEREILQYEEFLSAYHADDGYFSNVIEDHTIRSFFIKSQC